MKTLLLISHQEQQDMSRPFRCLSAPPACALLVPIQIGTVHIAQRSNISYSLRLFYTQQKRGE